jgi:geranylgeranyl reductase family protein
VKTVAVLGGGPGGATAAERLAASGLRTLLFDEKLAWEKPCGGGITYKAYSEFPYLLDNDTPKRQVRDAVISAHKVGEAKLVLDRPLLIYSRRDLNGMLLQRAEKAGAEIEQTRVTGIERSESGWRLATKSGTARADFLVVATGARNPLRNVGTEYCAADTMSALGYYVPAEQDRIDIQFLENLEGYIWVFPRAGHLSVGICGKGASAQVLRQRLELYMEEHGLSRKDAAFYSHMLPSLETAGWRKNRVAGPGWLAVGDAGGMVDPITGEGLYYAIRSGDMAGQMVINDAHDPSAKPAAYQRAIAHAFAADLEFASLLAKRVFLGKFLFRTVPQRMVGFMQRSPRFRELMMDLFAGTQSYGELRSRVLRNLNGTIQGIFLQCFLDRVIPSSAPHNP